MDLDRLKRLAKYKSDGQDINNDLSRKINNPKSFKYDQYFDGFGEYKSMPSANESEVTFKKNSKKERALKADEINYD